MELQISQEILDQADRCAKNHHCLSVDGCCCSIAEPVLFGERRFLCYGTEPCAYKTPFGINFFCICRVRKELFDQTGT